MPALRLGVLAAAMAFAGYAVAAGLPAIEAGQWEFMTIAAGEQPLLHRECLGKDYLASATASKPQAVDGCTDKGLRRQGKSVVRELRCTDSKGKAELRRSAWTVVSPIHMENRIERVVNGKAESVAQISVVRAGECPATPARK